MYDDPRKRALREFAALLDSLADVAATERRDLIGNTTVTEITAPLRTRESWSHGRRIKPALQSWVCRNYRWLVAALMFQMFTVVVLIVAMCG